MSDSPLTEPDLSDPKQRSAALFAGLVLQHVNMALMFLGRLPGPEGKTVPQDLNAATVFVDTLEMIEEKTRGNLSKDEAEFLKQGLMSTRMAFAQSVKEPATAAPAKADTGTETGKPAETPAPAASEGATEDEGKIRFTKKY